MCTILGLSLTKKERYLTKNKKDLKLLLLYGDSITSKLAKAKFSAIGALPKIVISEQIFAKAFTCLWKILTSSTRWAEVKTWTLGIKAFLKKFEKYF